VYRAATRTTNSECLRPSCSVTAKKVRTRAVVDKVGVVSSVGAVVNVGENVPFAVELRVAAAA
jgi:hypothetical protein